MLIPLAQLADFVPGWVFIVMPAAPLSGWVLGLIVFRRLSKFAFIASTIYYMIFAYAWFVAETSSTAMIVALLLLTGVPLGLVNATLPSLTRQHRHETQGFPVITEDRQG